jgi:hypothetical protein
MSLEKTEARAAGIHEVGMRMDDLLEGAQQEVNRSEGAALGLLQASKAVIALNGHVDTDITEGKYDLVVAEHVKRYVARAAQVVETLAQKARNQQLAAMGQVQGMQTAVAVTKKMFDAEQAKGAAIASAVAIIAASPEGEDVDLRHRPEGVHPPRTIKEQRLAEEATSFDGGGTVTQLPVSPKNGKGKRRKKA